jgi:N-acetyl-anhydromuramyl-L-alanine amidase AmpD
MEGSLASAFGVLSATERQVSWHFSMARDGALWQHYPVSAQTWHARSGNVRYLGVEHEGVAGEPWTDAQVEADVRLLLWLDEGPYVRGTTLMEHREISATACPSGRVRWDDILAGLEGTPMPTPDEEIELTLLRELARLMRNLTNGRLLAAPHTSGGTEIQRLVNGVASSFSPPVVVPDVGQ